MSHGGLRTDSWPRARCSGVCGALGCLFVCVSVCVCVSVRLGASRGRCDTPRGLEALTLSGSAGVIGMNICASECISNQKVLQKHESVRRKRMSRAGWVGSAQQKCLKEGAVVTKN